MSIIIFKFLTIFLCIILVLIGIVIIVSNKKRIRGKDFSIQKSQWEDYFWDESKWITLFTGKERKVDSKSSSMFLAIFLIIWGLVLFLYLAFAGFIF